MKIEVLGSKEVLQNLAKIASKVESQTYQAISLRTAELKREVETLMTGPPREGVQRGNRSSGTGKQVGPSGSPTIGMNSGRLINSLTTSVSVGTKARFSGEIGFPSSFRVSNPEKAKRYALNWPRKNVRDSIVVGTGHPATKAHKGSSRQPSDYAQEVILGTERLAGRNVLRMVLIDDIVKSSTLKKISDLIKGVFRSK